MKQVLVIIGVALLAACSSAPSSAPAATSSALAKIPVTTKSPEALAQYQKGLTFFENAHTAEGVEALKQALALDPEFATAKALKAIVTSGDEGLKEADAALAAAASLPEAERLMIEANVAARHGDAVKSSAALQRVTEVAPGDYLGFMLLGQQRLGEQKYAEAQLLLRKATELNPSSGGSQNQLGYASLRQGDTGAAIAAFEQYVRLQPQEANARDSLGEALMGAGRFADAEAEFQKALAMAPQFFAAQQGIGYTKFYRRDWAGGRAALTSALELASRPVDKLSLYNDLAAAAAAQRDWAQEYTLVDQMERLPGLQPDDLLLVPTIRAWTHLNAGKPKEAVTVLNAVVATADSGKFPLALSQAARREALRVRITAETQMGDATAVAKSSASLDSEAAAQPNDANARSAMHYGKAMLAVARRDSKAALAEFDQCSSEDRLCYYQKALSAEKAGDKAAAAAASERMLAVYGRDSYSLVLRSWLTGASKPS